MFSPAVLILSFGMFVFFNIGCPRDTSTLIQMWLYFVFVYYIATLIIKQIDESLN